MKILISERLFEGPAREFEDFIKSKYESSTQKILIRRLRNAEAVNNLCVLLQPGFPGDWHWLEGDRNHQISANLDGGRRIVFDVEGGLRQYRDASGGIDCKLITVLVLVEVVNYHK